uniref:Wiskott-Aldrich syndrome protein family member 3-like n=1 Tax=Ciona intestinalis TaxID=7719 RepID=F7A7L0_CIOIN|nr:wiskott-Aldrich syndrome protein family member 3-like [Ciona intestinalis]|eukprot:XP_002125707.1 wiskott-Aldrich syndrome protein family member 3-like [Ciona intestinalis]
MPLVKRSVTPSSLCRQKLPKNIGSELECVTNNTLSGVIMQLSSLSHHAEDVFGELFTEANSFYSRANTLQDRIDRLSVKVTQLDSTIEEVSLHDINMRKAFRSSGTTDQQVVSRESLPATLIETYNQADKPPPLQDLNQFRDDDRDALKIYTDPDYFFNLWREAMQKEMREAKEKRREQRKRERRANLGSDKINQFVKQSQNLG